MPKRKAKTPFMSSKNVTAASIQIFFKPKKPKLEPLIDLTGEVNLPTLEVISSFSTETDHSESLMDKAVQTDPVAPIFIRDFAKISQAAQQQQANQENLRKTEARLQDKFAILDKIGTGKMRRRKNLSLSMEEAFKEYLSLKEIPTDAVANLSMKDLVMFLMRFAEDKGRCDYGSGQKGIAPRTADNYRTDFDKVS